jgi:hypothetical protein
MATINIPPKKFKYNHEVLLNNGGTNFLKLDIFEMKVDEAVKNAVYGGMLKIKNDITRIANGGITTKLSAIIDLSPDIVNTAEDLGTALSKTDKNGTVSNATLLDYTLGNSIDTLYLPMPNNIKSSQAQRYDETNFNLEERMMRSVVGTAKNMLSTVMPDTANTLGSIAVLAEHLAKRANITVDPNTLMTYGGSLPRHFTFDFILNPNSKAEADYYNEVIQWIKYYSVIERTTNNLYANLGIRTLSVKNCFTFEMMKQVLNPDNSIGSTKLLNINSLMNSSKELNNEGGFYLSNINLILGGQDSLQLYYDGSPKTAVLTMSFVERQPLWSSDWARVALKYKHATMSKRKKEY